jgi:hypothetical protein
MKTFLYSTIAMIIIAVNVNSQNITFTRTSPEIVYGVPGPITDIESDANLVNNSSHTMRIVLKRVLNNLPNSNWTSSYCVTLCYPPTTDSSTETIPPGAQLVSMHFYPDSVIPGIAYARMLALDSANRSDSMSVLFGASTFPVGIRQITSTVNQFKLNQNYPNPFNPTTRISFSIDKSNYVDLRYMTYSAGKLKYFLASR